MFHRNQDKRNYSETRNPKSRISESCWTKYPFIRNSDPIPILRCHNILWSCILSRSLGSHLEVDPCIFMMWAFAESHLFVVYTETKPKKRSSTTNKILKKYANTFSFYELRKTDRKWRSSIGSILVRCKRWNFTRSMVVHCLLLENREEKPQRQAEYDRSCHNYVQCAIKKILECLSNNFRNVIKIKFTCWYLHVHKKIQKKWF